MFRRLGSKGAISLIVLVVIFLLLSGLLSLGCAGPTPNVSPNASPTTNPAVGNVLSVTMLDVGQGDSILVRSPSGQTMLVDAGDNEDIANEDVLPQLRQAGVTKLDYVVVTHPHQDHVGGMPTVLRNISTDKAAFAGQESTNRAYSDFLTLVQQKQIEPVMARRGVTLDLGPRTTVEVLNPPDQLFDDDHNNNSVVLKVTFGQVSFLLEGDAETKAIRGMLDAGLDMESQVIKVGHHGSTNGTNAALLRAVNPQYALISVGADNRYGHPHAEVLNLLKQRQIDVYRTDFNGIVTIMTDGTTVKVTTTKSVGTGG